MLYRYKEFELGIYFKIFFELMKTNKIKKIIMKDKELVIKEKVNIHFSLKILYFFQLIYCTEENINSRELCKIYSLKK